MSKLGNNIAMFEDAGRSFQFEDDSDGISTPVNLGKTWLSIVLTVANRLYARLDLSTSSIYVSGINQILSNYTAPISTSSGTPLWRPSFTAGIQPVQCHAHNDYWHRIPLYEGLAAGCVSTEADIWALPSASLNGSEDLFVGHSSSFLTSSRTLKSLYLDPIFAILSNQNAHLSNLDEHHVGMNGVFDTSPSTSLILLLDFKTSPLEAFDLVTAQLSALREKGWLTYWTPSSGLISRSVTVVATGDAPFSSIIANTTYRDIFFDAPLASLPAAPNTTFNANNSYYASASLPAAVGKVWLGKLSSRQKELVRMQVARAREVGLRSRYWDTVAWPVGWRNWIWGELVELEGIGGRGGGMLNVDDLRAASRWDWGMCVVGGVDVCLS